MLTTAITAISQLRVMLEIMKRIYAIAPLLALLTLSLAGCVTHSVIVEPRNEASAAPAESRVEHRYEAVQGRGPSEIAALRAAPAPENPEVIEGKNLVADQHALGSRGYVSIGRASYDVTDDDARDKAIQLGRELGADQIFIYRAFRDATNELELPRFVANYFVKFKLLFGATFRNLTSAERERFVGESGVQIGSVVNGTPASQANLMTGDYVLRFNGASIRDRTQFQDLLRVNAGKPVALTIRRGDMTLERTIRLGAMPSAN